MAIESYWLTDRPAEDTASAPLRNRVGAAGSGRIAAMQTIFVHVKCELGRAYEVADDAALNVEQVSEVYSVSGQFDLLMKCYLDDAVDIGHFVTESIQRLPGVKDTFTTICFKAFG
jgi:DNA-binding Lrp family transcriptional regulator